MRIIFFLFLGIISAFLLSEAIANFWRKYLQKLTSWHFHHSALGLVLFLVGLVGSLVGEGLSANPNTTLLSLFLIGSGVGMIIHHLLRESFVFSEKLERNFFNRHENTIERLLEIFPGALTWIALTSPIWLSFTLPFAVAYLILLADVYWLLSALRIAAFIMIGYRKMKWAEGQNWLEKLNSDSPANWTGYYQMIVLPTYREPLEVLTPAFDAVAHSNYPKEKILLAVGFEAWDDPQKISEAKKYLAEKIAPQIGGVFTTVHELQPGELKGPATNRNCIIRNAVSELKKLAIDETSVLATTLDADFVIHPQFLAGALHKYLSTPAGVRDKRSFTGVFLYYNNYWQAPTPMRLIATGTSFWQLAEMVGSDKYMNFSSLSMNLKSLLDIGLWMPDKVNDDSGFYWKAYYHFNGDYKVIPHFLPISGDTVLDTTLFKTFQNQYLQQKRWAYGVEHIPFIITQYFKNKNLSFWDKTDKLIFVIWGYLKWGVLALFVTFAGLLIPLINPHYSESVVSHNLPVISSWVLTFAFLGMFATVFVHEKTVPKRPPSWSLFKKLWSYIQWTLVPLVIIAISTIPAIDAQTSLMLGRYMEFRTTTKARLTT